MYYAIGVSVPSLHRESTDSLIYIRTGICRSYAIITRQGPGEWTIVLRTCICVQVIYSVYTYPACYIHVQPTCTYEHLVYISSEHVNTHCLNYYMYMCMHVCSVVYLFLHPRRAVKEDSIL